ncbi:MAG TPA: hypothetical protein VF945_09900 [Polyangia bacterium]
MRRLAIPLLLLSGCAHAPATKASTATPTATATKDQRRADMLRRLDLMTASLEKEDFAGALRGTDEWLAQKPDVGTLALVYNCRTWIRWGGGDPKAGFAENEKLREVVAHADAKTQAGALRHYWWDRAYLEAEAGRASEAESSRAEFERIATEADDADSKHVLVAWLATMRGDGAAAKAAASAVDPAKDDDVQDLYVLARALDAGGDAAGAEKVRALIRAGARYPMKPLILQQLARDASAPATRR